MRSLTLCSVALLLQPFPALADSLAATKTVTVVPDPVGSIIPRSLPGAIADYKVLFTNPIANLTKPVRNIVVEDQLPTNVVLRVSDLAGVGSGPIEFIDGSVIGTGLLGSGLNCAFVSLGSTSDCVEFSDGSNWAYGPCPCPCPMLTDMTPMCVQSG